LRGLHLTKQETCGILILFFGMHAVGVPGVRRDEKGIPLKRKLPRNCTWLLTPIPLSRGEAAGRKRSMAAMSQETCQHAPKNAFVGRSGFTCTTSVVPDL